MKAGRACRSSAAARFLLFQESTMTEPEAAPPAETTATAEAAATPDAAAKPEGPAKPEAPPPLRSVHTASFPKLLEHYGISVLVTTYQAGKLVMLRADGGVLNTHFRGFAKPMGLALDGNRLAIGTTMQIWEFQNTPAVCARLEPAGKHDACFLPRGSHVTGDIQIHEMGWARGELWFVNTRFSCLCTRDPFNSFVPRWRPPFITGLAPQDRCHLNGMAIVGGVPRLVTMLGETDTQGGWRANKKDGGLLMDISNNHVLTRGLSMPHSPRWYDNRLWVLQSGTGSIGTIDLNTGAYQSLAEVPGFTRGLDFWDRYAFVGLSQVRETAIFSGLPLTDRLQERNCGVWVIDITNGQTVAFVKFEDALQEIFAVTVLPGVRFPDLINDDDKLISDSFVLPDDALRAVPADMRSPVPGAGGTAAK